ncbi:hypothetical protein BDQ17DRAFT_1313845 [Cyathus striatus]|nr:hypothetical protein BDQ17DRAFT_1313845 [Cyathus striatus]
MSQVSVVFLTSELFQEIVCHLLPASLPFLRLVCKSFNEAVIPQMFSNLTICLKKEKSDVLLALLNAIADGKHPGVIHAKSVTIRDHGYSFSPPRQDSVFKIFNQYRAKVKKLLPAVMSGFQNATSVTWTISDNSLDWSRDCVVAGIISMKSLKALKLNKQSTNHSRDICLQTLPSLNELVIQFYKGLSTSGGELQGIPELIEKSSGSLRNLGLHVSVHGEPQSLEPLLSSVSRLQIKHLTLSGFFIPHHSDIISHFRSLVSLSLTTIVRKRLKDGDYFWDALKAKKIHLKEITLNEPNDGFIQYLKSYAGLKSLAILRTQGFDKCQSDRTALSFYADALSTHSNTLEKLSITPIYEGSWCFGEHAIQCLSQLCELVYLTISIVDCPMNLAITSYNSLPYLINRIHGMTDNQSYPVKYLMETVSILPKLQVLTIHGAELDLNRDLIMCSPGHKSVVPIEIQIDKQVTSFGH